MVKKANIPGSIEAWEDRALGASKAHVRRASAETEAAVEEALGMQAISIRLPRSTIETYKALAAMHGVGYQPLMRDAICRWAEGELKQMVIGAAEVKRQESQVPTSPAPKAPPADHRPAMKRAA
ncbi:MAG: hypothetical protein V4569_04425 [Pseudomonadota bacterium]